MEGPQPASDHRPPLPLLLALSTIALSVPRTALAQQSLCIVRDGVSAAAIVLPADPADDERLAARELQEHLERMSGAALTIAEGQAPAGLIPIHVGLALSPEVEDRVREVSEDPAAFLLSCTPTGISLCGLTPEGTLFAAYELLERLGCRWYLPGDLGTVIPERNTVTVPMLGVVQAPSFAHRHLQAIPQDLPWYRRQRLGGLYFPGSHGIPPLII